MAAFILPGKRMNRARLRNTPECRSSRIRRVQACSAAVRCREISMKTIAILMLAIAASGCSAFREKPYQASDTTASSATHTNAPGPTQRSAERLFNAEGKPGSYVGT